ncbi:hypothetical protein [Pseudomonas syringae]|uniref:hypothetical protein n=1 Tax=Pseudomonas syringae TaxID=317 RepID=UPI001F3D3C43|nr:hypothetical protein [Pseudomonas syringae]MCF5371952.1 hypothetical protein [Pseudomonas syringae]
MAHTAKLKAIGGLLAKAAVMESAGWFLVAIAVAGFWHEQYPAAETTTGFITCGLVFGALLVTGLQKLISGLFLAMEILQKSPDVITAMHASLVDSGDINVPTLKAKRLRSVLFYGATFIISVWLWLQVL